MELIANGFDITRIVGNMFYVILALIVFDVVTGLLAAAVERRVNSSINFSGLIRKAGEIVALMFITFVDAYFKTDGYIVKIGVGLLVVYEGISIVENFSKIGINLSFLTKYFDPNKVDKKIKRNDG